MTGATNALRDDELVDCGGWLQTSTGKAYYFEDPKGVNIRDIASALSKLCRFGGHCRQFYSVAEHSYHVSREVARKHPEHALSALLHDATEAYVVDVPRPLKELLGYGYARLELKAWHAICDKFDLPYEMHPSIKAADNAVLLAEKAVLLGRSPIPWAWAEGLVPAVVSIRACEPAKAEDLFLAEYRRLSESA